MMLVDDLMTTRVFVCYDDETAKTAALLMKEHNIGPLPIAARTSGSLLGMLTDRDLAVRVVAEGRDPRTTVVGDIMSGDIVTARAGDSIAEALELMSRYQLRRLPITDAEGKLVGILSQADVARRAGMQFTAELVSAVSNPDNLGLRDEASEDSPET